MAYRRVVAHPPLKLAGTDDSRASGREPSRDHESHQLQRSAADRLVGFLAAWAKKQRLSRPIRVLDASGAKPELLSAILELAAKINLRLEVTAIAETAVEAELVRTASTSTPSLRVLQSSIGDVISANAEEPFDCVHAALCLAKLRELPRLTAIGKLERAMTPCFVWTDHAKLLNKKQVVSLAARLDLGFCRYKKPIGSKLFTLAGSRRI